MRHTANMGLRALSTTALLLGLVLAGCEGDNVFATGEAPGGGDPTEDSRAPEIIFPPFQDTAVVVTDAETGEEFASVEDGAGVSVGDSILVSALFTDNVGVTEVTFTGEAHRGDPQFGTDVVVRRFESKTVTFDEPQDSIIVSRFLRQQGEDREEVYIKAITTDAAGNTARDSIVVVIGGPRARFINLPTTAVVDRAFPVDVRVEDAEAVSRVVLEVTGAVETTIIHDLDPPVAVDTVRLEFFVPETATGQMQLQATVTNTAGLSSTTSIALVDLIVESETDEIPPEARVTMEAGSLLELSDVVAIRVAGRDDSQGQGIQTIGYTLVSINETTGDTLVLSESVTVDPPTINAAQSFDVVVGDLNVDRANLPDTMTFRVVGWVVDAALTPHCTASDGTGSDSDFETLPCGTLAGETWALDEADAPVNGLELSERVVVSGRTIILPNADATIADAVVDTVRETVVLSNQTDSHLEIFDLQTLTFGTPIQVGDKPWGLFFDRAGNNDFLLVANSGGTNIDRVDMNTGLTQLSERILTPNTLLWEVEESVTEGTVEQDVVFYDFSDRPQFIAQDENRNVVYSTLPTGFAPDGTIRMADLNVDEVEVILYTEHAELQDAENTTAIARVDTVFSSPGSASTFGHDVVTVLDRIYGTGTTVSGSASGLGAAGTAVDEVQAQGSDARDFAGAWDVGGVGLSDTTFIASSGDGSKIAIGEGATSPTGRIFIYDAATQEISSARQVEDLSGNINERVFGVDLNYDGTFGVARGFESVYFFTPDLRLQGSPSIERGGAGAVLHPLHTDGPLGTDANTSFAFVGTGSQTIDIYDTRHFRLIGRVTIRDNIAGPLRAVLPFPADNANLTCPTLGITDDGTTVGQAVRVYADADGTVLNDGTDDACVVVKLAGITDAGGVVVADVRKADLTRFHPAR